MVHVMLSRASSLSSENWSRRLKRMRNSKRNAITRKDPMFSYDPFVPTRRHKQDHSTCTIKEYKSSTRLSSWYQGCILDASEVLKLASRVQLAVVASWRPNPSTFTICPAFHAQSGVVTGATHSRRKREARASLWANDWQISWSCKSIGWKHMKIWHNMTMQRRPTSLSFI